MDIIRCGYVSIVGRPNVGKSSLLNQLVDEKISIVSRKPQTTRHQILGISNEAGVQAVYVDTPGLQLNPKLALNRLMNKQVSQSVIDTDIILFVLEAMQWNEYDENVLRIVTQAKSDHIYFVINKIDNIANKQALLPFIDSIKNKLSANGLLPVSVKTGDGMQALKNTIYQSLPEGPALYPDDIVTDKNERFFAAEFLREKLMNRLGDELPYRLTITIDEFKLEKEIYHIHACIWVEKNGQKSIVIGKNGEVLKAAGKSARLDMEKLFNKKVNLKTWVKVKQKWTDSHQALKLFGYDI